MSYNVSSIPLFDKNAKRLSRKYPSLKKELAELIEILIDDPEHGIALGNNFFKIRVSVASKGKGKSGGARVVTYVKLTRNTVFLTYIFDKSEKITITDKELEQIFKQVP